MHEFSDHFVFWSKKQLSLEVFSIVSMRLWCQTFVQDSSSSVHSEWSLNPHVLSCIALTCSL